MTALVGVKMEEGDYAYDIVDGETPYNQESLLTWLCLAANSTHSVRSFLGCFEDDGGSRTRDIPRIVDSLRKGGVDIQFVYYFDELDGWTVNAFSGSLMGPSQPAMHYLQVGASRRQAVSAWIGAPHGNVEGVGL